MNRTAVGFGVTGLAGLFLALCVHANASRDYAAARQHYLYAAHSRSATIAREMQAALRSIYENVRTLTLLPSVRNIDRHGKNLDGDGRETIQQVYNNLASNVSVSEVYIVPVDLDPDKLDPVTGKTEEPILMFDQLIVHAGANAKAADPFDKSSADKAPDADEPEEVETYEYHQLRQQMKWLAQHYPDWNAIDGLRLPMISGSEVITCDNTTFVKTRADGDRSGLIFSIPFFGADNKLKGTVSAIILSNALRKLLPERDFALVNPAYGYVSRASATGQERASSDWVSKALPDPELIYSEVIPLSIDDPRGPWSLWVGQPDEAFSGGQEAQDIRSRELVGYGVVMALTLTVMACWALIRRNLSLVRQASTMLERRVAERTAEISFMATHDGLTGLPNRTFLREHLSNLLGRMRKDGLFAVMCLDLDHFKTVNDTLGHPVGDALLKAVTERVQSAIEEHDVAARLGGDEFIIVQTHPRCADDAAALARAIIARVSEPFELNGHLVVIGASIGIAVAPSDGGEPELLLRNADMALYRAKADGRGAYRFFEPTMDLLLQQRRRLELDLRHALAGDEFALHYQALVDVRSEHIVGFEALLRWQHPHRGMVPPSEFIPLAEEIGLIVPLGEWVIRRACADAVTWPEHVLVAVNLSPVQIRQANLPLLVASILADTGLDARRLEFEITETALIDDGETTLANLHSLRNLGVRIALDDFGTGYSSLSYLRSFPFDKIKIDRSFVRELTSKDDSVAIVRAVAGIGSHLGMSTTAEGVETAEQFERVRGEGCTQVQGFYFSRPCPASEVKKLLAEPVTCVA